MLSSAPSANRYQRLGLEENVGTPVPSAPLSAVELSAVVNPLSKTDGVDGQNPNQMVLKILLQERSFELHEVAPTMTVLQLKEAIAALTDVPTTRQRLIMAGKPLKPDEMTLQQLRVVNNTSIHLFPLPEPTAQPVASITAPTANNDDAGTESIFGAFHVNQMRYNDPVLGTVHFDPDVAQHGREVKLWSVLLIFLSAMTLFNNLSYFTATGQFGKGALDTFIFLLDTACSAGGMYIGSLGIKSIRTLDLEDIAKYVRYLTVLGFFSIVLRVAWVFDVSFAVKQAVKDSEHNAEENGGSNDGTTEIIDKKAVATFTVEAAIIAMICIGAWLSCLTRAYRLQHAVQSYDRRG